MIRFSFVAFLFAQTVIAVEPNVHISCAGRDYGSLSPFIIKADLVTDAAYPLFSVVTFEKQKSGELKRISQETHISLNKVCGVKVDFQKDCTSRVREMSGDIAFEFNCGGLAHGEAVAVFATPTQGNLMLECKNPKATPISFENCKRMAE